MKPDYLGVSMSMAAGRGVPVMRDGVTISALREDPPMYMPSHFAETDTATLHALMREHPLGTWVLHDGEQLVANHVPLMLHADVGDAGLGVLRGHVARANPAWRLCEQGAPCLVVFQGAQSYVSPSWYPSKQQHGKVVPTWNYAVVHAHGRARAVNDGAWLHANVSGLTQQHEARVGSSWQVTDAPAEYIEQMVQAIIGIEITIERLEGKWKVSQNRPADDRAGVVAALQQQPDAASHAMAALVGGRRR